MADRNQHLFSRQQRADQVYNVSAMGTPLPDDFDSLRFQARSTVVARVLPIRRDVPAIELCSKSSGSGIVRDRSTASLHQVVNFSFSVSGGEPSRPIPVPANVQYSATVGEPSWPTPVHSNVQVPANSSDLSRPISAPSGEGTSARVVDLDQDAESAVVANGGSSQPA
ncbi:hypothetical protein R1sor_018988 [Riccia sorocarpa]|uniref:Uncharacterized protein n=1 Tax=Riccia sorocarpa TaxID=122646 RepID=A0ABD3ICD7_9MARC